MTSGNKESILGDVFGLFICGNVLCNRGGGPRAAGGEAGGNGGDRILVRTTRRSLDELGDLVKIKNVNL